MIEPRIAKTADETDAFGPGRKALKVFTRPGVAKKTKRAANRRERRHLRRNLFFGEI